MTMQRIAVLAFVAVLTLFMASVVAAQNTETAAVSIGSRVRFLVDTNPKRLTGTLIARDSGQLTLRAGPLDTNDFKVRLASVRWPEVSTGIGTRRGAGALLGGMAGAAAGFVIASLGPKYDLDPRPLAALAGGIAGGFVGLMVGSAIQVERWEAVPLNALMTTRGGGE